MELDIMIYGRGQERLEGYQTFTAPSYWTDEMLTAMSSFSHLWGNGDLSDSYPEKFGGPDPWGRTYIFIAMPPPYCCALLRVTRVMGDDGKWLREVRNQEIWSLEGICAPFDRKEEFFAHIPSIILWLESDKISLYKRFMRDETRTLIIPDRLTINPYSDDSLSAEHEEILGDSATAFKNLVNRIKYSNGIFHFLFGPFSECFYNPMRAPYNITELFSTDSEPVDISDPFDNIKLITRKTRVGMTKKHVLRLLTDTGNMPRRCWQIYSPGSEDPDDVLTSEPPFVIPENGIDVFRMLSETETIKLFTEKMQWETYNGIFFFNEEV